MSEVLLPELTGDAVELCERYYFENGEYVNATRASTSIDGLKAVEKRVLLAASEAISLTDSLDVVSSALKLYHPHGDTSVIPVLYKAVRRGYLVGKGNFGNTKVYNFIDSAAPRYTKVMVNEKFNKAVMRLIGYVPSFPNEKGIQEPEYLPVPIPLAFTHGTMGIGIGLQNRIIPFLPSSVLEATLADDPTKLKAPDGVYMVNTDNEMLRKLWTTGRGRVVYGLKVYQEWSDYDEKNVTVVEGNADIVRPDFETIFEEEINQGLVYIRDESATQMRVVISRVKGIKRISDEEVYQRCLEHSTETYSNCSYVAENWITSRISMRDWCLELWKRYQSTVRVFKLSRLDQLNHKLTILNLIPKVSPLIIEQKETAQIAEDLDVKLEYVKEIESKPMKILRKTDFNREIKSILEEIQEIKGATALSLATDLVKVLDDAQKPRVIKTK